jgi:phosphoglucomutase
VERYLAGQYKSGNLSEDVYRSAKKAAYRNLRFWLTDPHIARMSPNTQKAILKSIKDNRWSDIVEVFRQDITFGTAGIRGAAALTEKELKKLARDGPRAPILKGPNTINDIVLLLKTAGVIKYALKKKLKKVAIGYDSRVAGREFAELIAESFIANSDEKHEFKIFMFDEASPFPELSFGLTTKPVRADLGILISASHNPCNYNGYKITDSTGAQLSGKMRNEIVECINHVKTGDILLKPLALARPGQLMWLGSGKPKEGIDYKGVTSKKYFIDIHSLYINQIKKFILDKKLLKSYAGKVNIGFAAFNGSGNKTVLRALRALGFKNVRAVSSLQKLNGMFPAFGWGEQPDPGDSIAADIAVKEYIREYGRKNFEKLDILIGTDPDADRAGFVIKTPKRLQGQFGKYNLLSANDAWTLLLRYRLKKQTGVSPKKKYITVSHVTTDAMELVANVFGVRALGEMRDIKGRRAGGYLKGRRVFTGFSNIAAFVRQKRKSGMINVCGAEESNGFSILGGRVGDKGALAKDGHVNDKDGVFAAILMAEVTAYAKSRGKTVFDLLDEVYLDKRIGYFATANRPLPRRGSFEGAEGITKKINLLKKLQEWHKKANSRSKVKTPLRVCGLEVKGSVQFKTGKYDKQHYRGFPDEGVRLFFNDREIKNNAPFYESKNYITIRPSGTSQTIRFYTQLRKKVGGKAGLSASKKVYLKRAAVISLAAQLQLLGESGYADKDKSVINQIKAEGLDKGNYISFITGD